MPALLPPLLAAGALAAVHVFGGRLRFLDVIPRSTWLSVAGGASVAYVFVHLLPELAERSAALSRGPLGDYEHGAFLVALVGLVAFYGLDRHVKVAQRDEADRPQDLPGRPQDAAPPHADDRSGSGVFWLHLAAFAVYNVLVGYLLPEREGDAEGVFLLYAVAMGLHFFVNDYGLRQDHRARYRRAGRWVLAAAVVGGAVLGLVVEVGAVAVALVLALVGGATILNVLKEELPEERQSRFGAFAAGAAAYAALAFFAG